MSEKIPPDISHLSSEDISKIIKESSAAEIEKSKAELAIFLDRAKDITSMDRDQIEKIATLMRVAKPKPEIGNDNGGCGWFSGGCC